MFLVSFFLTTPMKAIWSSVLVRFLSLANYRNLTLINLKVRTRNGLDHVSGKLIGSGWLDMSKLGNHVTGCSRLHLSCHLSAYLKMDSNYDPWLTASLQHQRRMQSSATMVAIRLQLCDHSWISTCWRGGEQGLAWVTCSLYGPCMGVVQSQREFLKGKKKTYVTRMSWGSGSR